MCRSTLRPTIPLIMGLALAALSLTACGDGSVASPGDTAAVAPGIAAEAHTLVVHEGLNCGCCSLWRKHMEEAGFTVEVHKVHELGAVKAAAAVPLYMASCHTAKIGGYFIEGHVPAQEVQRLLAERPSARGLTVPGMPIGSPGMEVPGASAQPYEVLLVGQDGSSSVYASYPKHGGSCCSIDLAEDM
jgi:hypothetical protein